MRTVDRYILRLLADRWVAPAGATTLRRTVLDLCPRPDRLATELATRGCRVTTMALRDGPRRPNRTGLVPRHLIAFGEGGPGSRTAGYLGYSVKRLTAPATGLRWGFTGTADRWPTARPAAVAR